MDLNDSLGIVYVLTNPAMPGLVKIGLTTRTDAKTRMMELFSTGVPLPFECNYAAKVNNPAKVEEALHTAFLPNRVNPKREFFEIEPIQAISIIKLLEITDETVEISKESESLDPSSKESSERFSKKRPKLNFSEMGIPLKAELVNLKNGEIAIVETERLVKFRGVEMSLTRATRETLENSYSVAPGPYWSFNGKTVQDIYNETYQTPD